MRGCGLLVRAYVCECVCLCLGATYVYGYGVLSFAACVVGVQPGCFCSLLTCFFGYPLSFMLILSDAWPRCMSARPCLSCPCTGCPLHPRAMTGRRQGSRVASCVGRSTRCVSVVLCVCVTAVTSTATLLLSHPPILYQLRPRKVPCCPRCPLPTPLTTLHPCSTATRVHAAVPKQVPALVPGGLWGPFQ